MKLKFKQNIGMSVDIAVVNTAQKRKKQAGAELCQAQFRRALDLYLILMSFFITTFFVFNFIFRYFVLYFYCYIQ